MRNAMLWVVSEEKAFLDRIGFRKNSVSRESISSSLWKLEKRHLEDQSRIDSEYSIKWQIFSSSILSYLNYYLLKI